MKHFFSMNSALDDFGLQQLLIAARKELQLKPMTIAQMVTEVDVICINASSASEYIPPSLDVQIHPRQYITTAEITEKEIEQVNDMVTEGSNNVLAYILASVQTKEIKGYFEATFGFKKDFELEPQVVTHLPDAELIYYLKDYLQDSSDKAKKVEVFNKRGELWKTLSTPKDLDGVMSGKRPPAILQKPFFSDISLKVTKNGMETISDFAFLKLRQVLGQFNSKRDASGHVNRSRNSLYLKWAQIDKFKIASTQCKYLVGISIKGTFTATQKFLSDHVSGTWVKPSEVDFFRIRTSGQTMDLTLPEVLELEVNLETQQSILTRGVGKEEFHLDHFKRLKLFRGSAWVTIHKLIPFNRGESNFDMMLHFLATKYTEYEKARQMRKGSIEFDVLRQKQIVAGDLPSQLVLSSLNLLNVVRLETYCVGFSPKDILNPMAVSDHLKEEDKDLKVLFALILDLTHSPNFTEHNFAIRTRNMRAYLEDETGSEPTAEALDLILQELEDLTQYMDDFFKLNIYKRFEEELEVDQTEVEEEEFFGEDDSQFQLDENQKDFIGDNYHFFKKRALTRSSIVKVERLRFYQAEMRPYLFDQNFDPDLVVYAQRKDLVGHFKWASQPAVALSSILGADLLVHEEEEDYAFLQFMRRFTTRVHDKALETNQTFHHQYKHSLAELTFLADEKLHQMQEQLALLDDPNNKEKAYKELYEKIKEMFHSNLKAKQQEIEDLKKEQIEIAVETKKHHKLLQKLLGEEIPEDSIDDVLATMPERLDEIRLAVLGMFKKKRGQIVQIFNPFAKAQSMCFGYFQKVLSYQGLFQKAVWVRRKEQMLLDLQKECYPWFDLSPEALEETFKPLANAQGSGTKANNVQKQVEEYTQKMKDGLVTLQQSSARGMFQDKTKEEGTLQELLEYYLSQSEKLQRYGQSTQDTYKELSKVENELFELQVAFIDAKLEVEKGRFRIKIAQMVHMDRGCMPEVEALLTPAGEIPREIRKELNEIRGQFVESFKAYLKIATPQNLEKVLDFSPLSKRQERRLKINEISKALINFRQGAVGIVDAIRMEEEDLEYMKSQEGNLEKVAMSKALPSTRILLKTQYIPLIEREKQMLERADYFLGTLISKGKELRDVLANTFFRKRYGFPQFMKGKLLLDSQGQMRSHTLRNIQNALMLWQEKFVKGTNPADKYHMKGNLEKENILSIDVIKQKIRSAWVGESQDRFLVLPTHMDFDTVLNLCDYKEQLVKEDPRPSRSRHSVLLIYVNEIDFTSLQEDKAKLERYNQAILSNIFIDVDGVKIFNNRDSIYEAVVRATFGMGNEPVSEEITRSFLYEV